MVKHIILISLAVVGLYAPAQAETSSVAWRTDVDAAFKDATEQGKWVYADFYTTTCPYCVKMDREVYSRSDVADLLSNFVTLKVNASRNLELSRRYEVQVFPTVLVLTGDGKVIETVTGYRKPDEFKTIMKPLAAGENPLEKIAKAAAAEPGNATGQLQAGYEFLVRQWYGRSRDYLERAAELSGDGSEVHENAMRLVTASYLHESNAEKALEWIGKYEKAFPGSEYVGAMYFDVGQLRFEKEEYADAAKCFALAKDAAPGFTLKTRANWMLSEARSRMNKEQE